MNDNKYYWCIVEKFFLSSVYTILLVLLYEYSVYPTFGYMGFPYYGTNWVVVGFQIVFVATVTLFLPNDFEQPSDLCSWVLFKLVFIPTIVIPSLVVSEISLIQVLFTNLILVFCMLSIALVSKLRVYSSLPTLTPGAFWIISLCITAFFLIFIIIDYGFSFSRLFNLRNYSEIYDIRYAHREAKSNSSIISNYGLLWLAKVIVPLFWGWGLYKKSSLVISIALVTQIGLFAVSAHKSFLFALVFIYFIYWLSSREYAGIWFLRVIVGFTAFSAAVFYFVDFELFVSIIVRRVFIVPGMLSGFFLEFYTNHSLALYSHNFLSGLLDTNYTTSPAFTVGKEYFGRSETSANVNFWGDSYANLGYFGFFVITLILNITLLMINAFSFGKSRAACLSLFAITFWTITETSLTTTFVSHGLLLALLLAALMPKYLK